MKDSLSEVCFRAPPNSTNTAMTYLAKHEKEDKLNTQNKQKTKRSTSCTTSSSSRSRSSDSRSSHYSSRSSSVCSTSSFTHSHLHSTHCSKRDSNSISTDNKKCKEQTHKKSNKASVVNDKKENDQRNNSDISNNIDSADDEAKSKRCVAAYKALEHLLGEIETSFFTNTRSIFDSNKLAKRRVK
uniref:Uncharacterized protein n=1 Tax=Lygus hesperus TaxID=30085 RepID=A0A0A9VXZ9_LYGHE